MAIVKEYEAKIDNKHRVTIRGAQYEYYNVKEFSDGHLELEPRVLMNPNDISVKTLQMMDSAVDNLKTGKASEPIDLSAFSADES
jgi:hypothetical protein